MDSTPPTLLPTPTVTVSADKQSASLCIPEGVEPDAISEFALRALVKEHGVSLTPGVERLLSLAVTLYTSRNEAVDTEIARATSPEHGTDAWIEWAEGYNPAMSADPSTEQDADTSISFYDHQSFIRVVRGDAVAILHPATDGTDGVDVCGRSIPATAGKRLGIKIDQSLVLDSDQQLIAQIDGVLKLQNNALRIDPVLDIRGTVDFSTGNIDFDGDVVVRDGIRDHFRIHATKDVVIDGLIDASHIQCGGKLQARRGFAGREEGTLDVGGDAEIGYIQSAKAMISGCLLFAKELMHSELTVGGDVVGESGKVIGGSLHALGNVRIAELGAPGGTPTHIRLGPNPVLTDQRSSNEAQQRQRTLERMQSELGTLRTSRAVHSATNAERMTELEFEIAELEQLAAADAANPVPEQVNTSTLEVSRAIHARVTLDINDRTITFSNELRGPVRIWLEGQSVMCQAGNAPPAPLRGIAGVSDRRAA